MTGPLLPETPPLIRKGGVDDAHAIRTVFLAATADEPYLRESDPDTGLPEWLEGFLGCGYLHELWIAELHGRVVGFATLIVDWLCHLYVTPYAQNRGAGTALLAHAKRARPDGPGVTTHGANTGARRLHERHGFVMTEEDGPEVTYSMPEK
ncbi:N-acetyltransferase family protein [Streptosporangium sp. V21-05]|uniref:GNAT family N-acetyltransferase n=1 Tax=Streptosporangium sp. V21-05 TaxID=3446115 RepID=UPI003F52BF17